MNKIKTIITMAAILSSSILTAGELSNEEIKKSLDEKFGQVDSVSFIKETDVKNNYFIVLKDGSNVYYTKDSDSVVLGDIYNIKTRANVSQKLKGEYNLSIIGDFNDSDKILYPSSVEGARWVTVFTDPTCGYCQKVHENIEKYNDLGISIAYVPFPRGPKNTKPYDDVEKVWCSKDRQESLTLAKKDQSNLIDFKLNDECENTIKKSLKMVEKLRIMGTPSFYIDDGVNIPGYIDPPTLLKMMSEWIKKSP